jgi:hypothetical protein
LLDQDNALGGWVLTFKSGLEKNTFVIAFRRAHEFFHVRRTYKISRKRISEGRATRLHEPDELALRAVHPEILRFEFKRLFVIAIVEKLESMQRRRAGLIFIGAFFRARGRMCCAAGDQ